MSKVSTNRPKVLLLGATSILGHALASQFANQVVAAYPKQGKIKNKTKVTGHWLAVDFDCGVAMMALLEKVQPAVVIYCHAVCDVSNCQADATWAHQVNVGNLARCLEVLDQRTRFIYVSSDHVFGEDGCYDESSLPCPISVYGETRVAAEQLVLLREKSLIVRAGLAIGPSVDGRSGHLDWLCYRHKQHLPITIVHDESRSVMWACDLANRVMSMAVGDLVGLRHVPAAVCESRPKLASQIALAYGITPAFKFESRREQLSPHLGRVSLVSQYDDVYARALPRVVGRYPAEIKNG